MSAARVICTTCKTVTPTTATTCMSTCRRTALAAIAALRVPTASTSPLSEPGNADPPLRRVGAAAQQVDRPLDQSVSQPFTVGARFGVIVKVRVLHGHELVVLRTKLVECGLSRLDARRQPVET